ncbi:MAG: sigma-54-dependent Fis family transcriptional regulator [Bacteroidales bacterium]|nr:sigma-54-dependent Fis family transcriptional regulator [Bacteroidales bacterium]
MNKILIADDEPSVRYSFKKLLKEDHYDVLEAANGVDALRILGKEHPDLIVMDIEMPGMSGLDAIRRIKEIDPGVPVIIMTAYGTTERVIEAMKLGAYDYMEKPFDIDRMRTIIREALGMKLMTEGGIHLRITDREESLPERIVGKSPAIKEVYKMIGKVAVSDASILINGESGTGKELVAKAIHTHSNRADKPFLPINCAAIPDTLLESELFGFEKGAFTDAGKTKSGKFESVDTGTIFLDEIGDMSLPLQAKLLRVVQEGTFERLGSNKTQKVDVRIIAATNKNLELEIQAKRFREDLYYRLKVITITLPPLRMHMEDIPLLTEYFIERQSRLMKNTDITIPLETMEKLLSYSWPGNVRELENTLRRAVLLSKNQIITPDLVTIGPEAETSVDPTPSSHSQHLTETWSPMQTGEFLKASPPQFITLQFPENPDSLEGKLYHEVIDQTEKELLRLTLGHTRGNQVKAARLLGISRVMLHDRMKKYGLDQ